MIKGPKGSFETRAWYVPVICASITLAYNMLNILAYNSLKHTVTATVLNNFDFLQKKKLKIVFSWFLL